MANARERKPDAPHLGLTPERRARVLKVLRDSGLICEAARATGVAEDTLWRWRQKHPDFEREIREAQEHVAQRIGKKAVRVIEQHINDVLTGKHEPDRYQLNRDGEPVLVQRGARVAPNVGLIKAALTRTDPNWTRDRKEIEVKDFDAVMDSLTDGGEPLTDDDPAPLTDTNG